MAYMDLWILFSLLTQEIQHSEKRSSQEITRRRRRRKIRRRWRWRPEEKKKTWRNLVEGSVKRRRRSKERKRETAVRREDAADHGYSREYRESESEQHRLMIMGDDGGIHSIRVAGSSIIRKLQHYQNIMAWELIRCTHSILFPLLTQQQNGSWWSSGMMHHKKRGEKNLNL